MTANYKLQRAGRHLGRTVRAIDGARGAGAETHRGPPLNKALGIV